VRARPHLVDEAGEVGVEASAARGVHAGACPRKHAHHDGRQAVSYEAPVDEKARRLGEDGFDVVVRHPASLEKASKVPRDGIGAVSAQTNPGDGKLDSLTHSSSAKL
jgi:hypothetical protein